MSVTVSAPAVPDLVAESPRASPSSVESGDSFTLSATVRNRGDMAAAATTLRYYQSGNATISSTDTEVGTDSVGGLAIGGSSSESIVLTAPNTPGEHYYGACVDSVSEESDTQNNCTAGVRVTVTGPTAPDLAFHSENTEDIRLTVGDPFIIGLYVRNQGNAASPATTLRWYESSDATISTSDTQLESKSLSGLAPATDSGIQLLGYRPNTAGIYYYGACVDAVPGESDTTNNCSSGPKVIVESANPAPGTPDLTVEAVAVSPATVAPGDSFTLSATVRNRGDTAAAATTLRWTQNRLEVGTAAIDSLQGSGTSMESIVLTAPSHPTVYLYNGCVDTVAGEDITRNNCASTAAQLNVQ